MAKRAFTNVVYTSNNGKEYAYKIAADVFAQAGASTNPKVGGRDLANNAADNALDPMPQNIRPRTVEMRSPGQGTRRIVCLSPDADLYVTPAVETTLTLPVFNDPDGATFTRAKIHGEEFRGKNPDV